MRLPRSLRDGVIAWSAEGRRWAESLPASLEYCRQRWDLRVGEPLDGGATAWVAPAERADGSACVLKLSYPDEESEHEGDALLLWAGAGAVRLLERNAEPRALLLERLSPGTSLFELADPEEALELACAVLQRLWVPAPAQPFATAQSRAADWAEEIAREYERHAHPFDAALLNAAIPAFERLASYDGASVVLHQDFHRGNVLRAEREPWLAIDPKPLIGERAFDARWLLNDLWRREPRIPLSPTALLERLARELSLEPERIRLWTLARAIENALWSYESGEDPADDLKLAQAFA